MYTVYLEFIVMKHYLQGILKTIGITVLGVLVLSYYLDTNFRIILSI